MGKIIHCSKITEKHYSSVIATDIASICMPLKHYGIDNFIYARFFNNGLAYVLTNHWDQFHYHCQKQYQISSSVPNKLLSNKFHYFPLIDSENTSFNQAFHDWYNLFNFNQPIYFIEKYLDYTNFFCYSCVGKDPGVINFYLNNIDVLEKFKFYFKDKARKLIEKSDKK